MTRLTTCMVTAKTRQVDLGCVKKLNCWGSELVDVSLLRSMPCVEVLALSLNKITSLVDFQECWNLQELYLRKNNIPDLSELRYLQNLPHLKSLWLGENPCSNVPGYRMLVLRALPKLQILDDIAVTPEEVHQACSRAHEPIKSARPRMLYHTTDQINYNAEEVTQESTSTHKPRERCLLQRNVYSSEESKKLEPISSEAIALEMSTSRPRNDRSPPPESSCSSSNRSHARLSFSEHHKTSYLHCRRPERAECSVTQLTASNERVHDSPSLSNRLRDPLRGFNRRPVSRDSNLLSSALCLIKELDYRSLEVVELAVQCRLEEIADRQDF